LAATPFARAPASRSPVDARLTYFISADYGMPARVLSDMCCASRVTGTGNTRLMAMQEGG
jgi:hypothetical protein